jgi:hypothetical protein
MLTMNTLGRCAIAVGAVLLSTVPLAGHHSFAAEYDEKKPIKLQGKLVGASLVNPHGWLHMDVTEDAANRRLVPPVTGKTVKWSLEIGGANALYRRGWRPRDLPVGHAVSAEGYMAKDGSATINAVCITFEDGRTLFSGGSAPGAERLREGFKGTGLEGSKVCGGAKDSEQ